MGIGINDSSGNKNAFSHRAVWQNPVEPLLADCYRPKYTVPAKSAWIESQVECLFKA
jgi:hypothetical protein